MDTEDAVNNFLNTDTGLLMLDEVGYRGNPTKAGLKDKTSILQYVLFVQFLFLKLFFICI